MAMTRDREEDEETEGAAHCEVVKGEEEENRDRSKPGCRTKE